MIAPVRRAPDFRKDAFDMIDPRVASGLRDIPPSSMIPRERALATFRKTFADFGFVPIETPHIERMEVLTGKGAGSDEVLRQIYSVTNKGGEPGELALRFDLTVPFARFVAKHINELGKPFKRYAIGSVFRGERPAKGRFREFVQCDFDTVGTESPLADAETAQVIHAALSAIGVPAFTITLNNRKILDGMLGLLGLADRTGPVLRSLDKLAKIGRDGVSKELRAGSVADEAGGAGLSEEQANRVLDFVEGGRGGVEVLSRAEETLGSIPRAAEGIANLRTIFDLLDASGVPASRLRIDLGLARGLDYYTGIVYETTVDGWEKFGSVASGGRYDNLTKLFTDQPLPGVGASIGLDRLLALLEEAGWAKGASTTVPVLLPNFPGADPRHIVGLASRLRAVGIGAEVYPDAVQTGKQLQYGSTRGHKLAVIVGPSEQESKTFNLRDLATRRERKAIPWDDLEEVVLGALVGPLVVEALDQDSGVGQ
jgi:histidyl-tRNA synthetase